MRSPVLNWQEAQHACEAMGGYLAETSDDLSVFFTTKHIFQFKTRMWLGATDLGREGSWKWVKSGRPVNGANWAPNEPNNDGGAGHCMEVGWDTHGEWNDRPCADRVAYICQRDDTVCDGWLRGYKLM